MGGMWSRQSKIVADDTASGDCFGSDVTIYDANAFIGAYADALAGPYYGISIHDIINVVYKLEYFNKFNCSVGSVHFYTQVEGTWSRQSKIVAADSRSGDYFGNAVTIYNTDGLIGAFGTDDNGYDSGTLTSDFENGMIV
jgi:hypothetical protein